MQYLRFVLVLLMALPNFVLAGDIRFFAEKGCNETPQYERNVVPCGECITPPEESSAILVENLSKRHLVTVYNMMDCASDSVVIEVRADIT
jgi:hypothetical protein